jgi:hypothetical protein
VYIPGLLNRVLQVLGGMVPAALVASFVGNRWRAAHRRRGESLRREASLRLSA